nr:immunoglobulin heavy chain junction region [Mus musculus]MBK4184627.1 immunoglobulin heavy chain junction region [Mus musculus]
CAREALLWYFDVW